MYVYTSKRQTSHVMEMLLAIGRPNLKELIFECDLLRVTRHYSSFSIGGL